MLQRSQTALPAIVFGLVALLSLPGEPLATPASQAAAAGQPGPRAFEKDQDSANSQLLAAAEPFEALTEQSFSAKPGELDSLISHTEQAATKASSLLPPAAKSDLERRVGEIVAAKNKRERSAVALAAVERYRILVTAAQDTKIPTAVSLLDYSGFRYDTDLKSQPSRWADMQAATDFGRQQWASISGQVTDVKLKNKFDAALQRMAAATSSKSAAGARSAIRAELNLVDKLEAYFNRS